MHTNRRRHFLINKPLQLRFMLYISLPLFTATTVILLGLYIGIWGSILGAFTQEDLRNDLLTASRLTDYEEARQGSASSGSSELSFFKQAEKLSVRQREVFKQILDESNKDLFPKALLLLVLIAWGSIFISHKVAGPFYRFCRSLEDVQKGDLRARMQLRKFDEGQGLAKTFNASVATVDETLSKVKTIIRQNEADPARALTLLKAELSRLKTSADN
ncbi:MAG: hypothetical protein FGM27_00225 [Candidatus Omnitrophica bacterium]|nr:hypothetical protein [Candidatus Omnitrophota bacterium]